MFDKNEITSEKVQAEESKDSKEISREEKKSSHVPPPSQLNNIVPFLQTKRREGPAAFQNAVHSLQNSYGNKFVGNILHRLEKPAPNTIHRENGQDREEGQDGGNEVVELDPIQVTGDVYQLRAGQSPSEIINTYFIQRVINCYTTIRSNHETAISNFQDKIETPTQAEVRSQFAQDMVGAIIDVAVKSAAEAANVAAPGAGFAIGLVYDSINTATQAVSDAQAAMAQIERTQFVTSLRSSVSQRYSNIVSNLESRRAQMETRFDSLASEGGYSPGDERVVGAQARYLRGLEEAGDQFLSEMSKYSSNYFEMKIFESWINTHFGVEDGFWGPYVDGRVEIYYELTNNYNDTGEIAISGESAEIKAPNGNRIGGALNPLLQQMNLSVWDLHCRKMVKFRYYEWGSWWDSREALRDVVVHLGPGNNITDTYDPFNMLRRIGRVTQLPVPSLST